MKVAEVMPARLNVLDVFEDVRTPPLRLGGDGIEAQLGNVGGDVRAQHVHLAEPPKLSAQILVRNLSRSMQRGGQCPTHESEKLSFELDYAAIGIVHGGALLDELSGDGRVVDVSQDDVGRVGEGRKHLRILRNDPARDLGPYFFLSSARSFAHRHPRLVDQPRRPQSHDLGHRVDRKDIDEDAGHGSVVDEVDEVSEQQQRGPVGHGGFERLRRAVKIGHHVDGHTRIVEDAAAPLRCASMTVVFVHGGVAGRPKELRDLAYAVGAGAAMPSALDAVEAAVAALEDDPVLNAGFGSTLTRDGTLELDAGIACAGHCGGVANVRVRHPISLARRVLEDTPHVLMTGAGANALGADMELLDDTSPAQRERWRRAVAAGELDADRYGAPEHVDTVGAVALGEDRVLAAASSTGGVFGKLPGRVGDAPVHGAGVYTTAEVAVVGTGVGELFLEMLAAAQVAHAVEGGADPQEACEEVVARLGERERTAAGLLVVDRRGRYGAAFRGASWSVWGPSGRLDPVRLD